MLEIILAATDLVAWTKLIGFHGHTDLATCEIATFRYRVLHVAARITRGARNVRLRTDATWRWATAICQAWQRLRAAFPDHPAHPSIPTQGNPALESPPTAAGRPVTPTCNNQHPNRVSANPPPPTTAARKIEARASCN